MLRIIFGDEQKAICYPCEYFNAANEKEYFDIDIVKKVIRDIDGAKVSGSDFIISSMDELIAPSMLSASAKTLIMIYCEPDIVFNASQCGDDAAKLILEIARLRREENRDITINLRRIMDFGEESFDIFIENTQQTVHSMKELATTARELLGQECDNISCRSAWQFNDNCF